MYLPAGVGCQSKLATMSRRAPVSKEVKAEKVAILNGLSRAYRRALLVAYNARSFTMYQHSLCSHMGELQAHLQSDLCDYNQECIEHLGKQFTQVLHEGTNMLLLEGQMGCLAQAVAETHLRKRGRCLLYTSPSPRDMRRSRMPSSA